MRFARRVAEHCLSLRKNRGHDGVLRRHHAGLVEEHARTAQVRRLELVQATSEIHHCAELVEGVQMRIEPPAPDHVAARRRHRRAAEAREQRSSQEERRADLAAEAFVRSRLRRASGVDAHLVQSRPRSVSAKIGQEVEHRVHVPDARHVREGHRTVGEKTRSDDRERTVLVSGGADRAAQAA